MYNRALRPDQITALYHLRVELGCRMTKLARQAVDRFIDEMERKREHAHRAGTSLSDWLDYEREMEEASGAAKQHAGLQDINAPF